MTQSPRVLQSLWERLFPEIAADAVAMFDAYSSTASFHA
jgi:hypothetical protein